jgi:hypothetical protein
MNRFFVGLSVALWSVGAHAQETTSYLKGTELARLCGGENIDTCQSYLMGLLDGEKAVLNILNVHLLCVPRDVTIDQVRLIVVREGQKHPEKLHYTASSLVYSAIKHAFPCERSR